MKTDSISEEILSLCITPILVMRSSFYCWNKIITEELDQ